MSRDTGAASTPAKRGPKVLNLALDHFRRSKLQPEQSILDGTVFVVFMVNSNRGVQRFCEWFDTSQRSETLYEYAKLQWPELDTVRFDLVLQDLHLHQDLGDGAIHPNSRLGQICRNQPRMVVRVEIAREA